MIRLLKVIVLASVSALALTGCPSHTGVIPTGKDTYMIAKQQATGFPGLGNMKAEIIMEGSEHCKSLNRQFQLLSSSDSQPPYVLGNYPRSEIHFTCLNQNDAAYNKPR